MGSCISKCKPKPKPKTKPYQEFSSHVQDKLVISQAPLSPIPTKTPPRKLPLCPSPSPTYSSSSFSSFSCPVKTNSGELTSSLSSASSCSSSILCSKDRSFSNEFLWSCVKENPQVIGLDPIKHRVHHQRMEMQTKPNVAPVKQSIPETLVRSTTQKRPRANSPTLTRQKSFRVEPKGTNSTHCRNLRPPSPSRRFNGNNCNHKGAFSNYSAKECSSSSNKHSVISTRKENVTPASPRNRQSRDGIYLRTRETSNQIRSKADEVEVKEVRSDELMDILMEDIDNPLIALDCFIFL